MVGAKRVIEPGPRYAQAWSSTGAVLGSAGYPHHQMAAIQATRLKKGMLVKIDQDLFRVLELQHVTQATFAASCG